MSQARQLRWSLQRGLIPGTALQGKSKIAMVMIFDEPQVPARIGFRHTHRLRQRLHRLSARQLPNQYRGSKTYP